MGIIDGFLDRLSECMAIDSSRCSRIRHKSSVCAVCTEVCPGNAITITSAGGKVIADWNACTACGRCFAECPNGVFTLKLQDRSAIAEHLKNSSETVCFACDSAAEAALLPSCGFADRKLMIKAAARRFKTFIFYSADCKTCRKDCAGVFEKEAEAAGEILKLAGSEMEIRKELWQKKSHRGRLSANDPQLSRREFFGYIKVKAKETAGKTLCSLAENEKERQRTILTNDAVSANEGFIRDLRSLGGDGLVTALRSEGRLADVDIDREKCKKCGICARICPFGVFTAVTEKIKGRDSITDILVEKDKCTGCGICGIVCFSRAVTVNPILAVKA